MKAYTGVEAKLHGFLTSAPDEGASLADQKPIHFTQEHKNVVLG
jgi:hypothetical protein